jgi:benzoyl-CoA reductase/2-hydroxyglutaryl-CoA dehydratase subunit BcrC/BadD/HgdB
MTSSPASQAPPEAPLDRLPYLHRQKEDLGRRLLGVLPIHHPKALLTAFDLLAVEIWGPPGPPRSEAAGRIQAYVCAIVRNALAFLSSDQAEVLDGVLFPHTCDSIQGLATQVTDLGGWNRKTFTFQHPRGVERASARRYLEAELRSFSGDLEQWTGRPLAEDRLAWALDLHAEIDAATLRLLQGRARLPMTDPELYALLRRGEWLWPEDHLAELRAAEKILVDHRVQTGIPILITGYVPEPSDLLKGLSNAGAFVAADDYAAVGRRIPRTAPTVGGSLWQRLAERQIAHPPCPTQGVDQSQRLQYLQTLADGVQARGVLIHVQKFCEPELFDVPLIQETFSGNGLPVLVLEGELETALSGQTETRIEAFVELLRQGSST